MALQAKDRGIATSSAAAVSDPRNWGRDILAPKVIAIAERARQLDHLSFAQDADENIQLVSLHASRASVLIIMANSETEMILTPRWYTVAQVAQLLNYGESKVRMLIITGQLRSIKDGRSRRILPEWVEAYVQDHA